MRRCIRSAVPILIVAVLALMSADMARPSSSDGLNDQAVSVAFAADFDLVPSYPDVTAASETLSVDGSVGRASALAPQPEADPSSQLDRDRPKRARRYAVLKEPQSERAAGTTIDSTEPGVFR